MLFDWFNAREAVNVGASLADHFLPESGQGRSRPDSSKNGHGNLARFRERVVREVRPLRLNLFKRARLLNSFKWRLLEHGVDRAVADELTQTLILQIFDSSTAAAAPEGGGRSREAKGRSSGRVPLLLKEVDLRFAKGEYVEAVESLGEVLEIDPKHYFANNKLGAALCQLGRYAEAEEQFRRAIASKPSFADPYYNLGLLLYWKRELAGSESALRRAVKLDPRNAEALVSLGVTLGARGRLEDAKSCFEKALRVQPRSASALSGLGWLAATEGRFGDAERLLRQALEADPTKPYPLAALADVRRMTPADGEWLEAVQRMIAGGVAPNDECSLRYALGKYFDDIGKFSEAFAHYKRANELQKLIAKPYSRSGRVAYVDDMLRLYTRESIAASTGAHESAKPVFVVGMMRSGTSLVEQIIASHPQAVGAGELGFWTEATNKHHDVLRRQLPDTSLAGRLAESYLETLARHSREALRVIDKAPVNSDYLGLIHVIFPNARIIYLQRDPIDTCLSCYFQQFAAAPSFTMDLSDLAHYYREHYRLIEHWRSVLPSHRFLEVPYAELVANQEAWSRRMIEFVGLEWDPCCLEFHKTRRAVMTASSWQVRQRIYSSSVGRWRNYERHIGPLLELRELKSPTKSGWRKLKS